MQTCPLTSVQNRKAKCCARLSKIVHLFPRPGLLPGSSRTRHDLKVLEEPQSSGSRALFLSVLTVLGIKTNFEILQIILKVHHDNYRVSTT